jgi:hypothetical protein
LPYPSDGARPVLRSVSAWPFAREHGFIRVVDESGEDYLFPDEYFVRVNLPQAVEKKLRKIA